MIQINKNHNLIFTCSESKAASSSRGCNCLKNEAISGKSVRKSFGPVMGGREIVILGTGEAKGIKFE